MSIGPGDTGVCPTCSRPMDEGRYWHMRDQHGRMEHYKQGMIYACVSCGDSVFIPHNAAWPQTCPKCGSSGIFASIETSSVSNQESEPKERQ